MKFKITRTSIWGNTNNYKEFNTLDELIEWCKLFKDIKDCEGVLISFVDGEPINLEIYDDYRE
jgi:hypothetical protein